MVAYNYSSIKSITQATRSRNETTPLSEPECGNVPIWQMRSISAAMCRLWKKGGRKRYDSWLPPGHFPAEAGDSPVKCIQTLFVFRIRRALCSSVQSQRGKLLCRLTRTVAPAAVMPPLAPAAPRRMFKAQNLNGSENWRWH